MIHCVKRHALRLSLLAASIGVAIAPAQAAPNISRLTPPSNPVVATANTLARFLPGQKFDLQATVQPTAGTVSSVVFKVNGAIVATLNNNGTTANQFGGNAGLVKNGLASGLAANSVVASIRGYSVGVAGLYTLTVEATDASGTTSRSGNFEVVGITANNGRQAKNIVIMLGDGMGSSHRTAARIVGKGYLQGKAQNLLAMDTFPFTGMVMTASLNSIITDSAPGMANYVNGNKANNNEEGVFPDDTTDAFDNPRIEYLSEYLKRTKGTSLGIVTTADVFDATPAANAVHTSNRGNGSGIVDQFLDDRNLTGLKVLMGGGRKWFLPNSSATDSISPQPANGSQRRDSQDYVLSTDIQAGWGAAPGAKDRGRNLIADFQAAGFTYAPDKTTLLSAGTPGKLLGLFSYSNMNVAFDKINGRRGLSTVVNDFGFPDQPMLDEMTSKALDVLSANNTNGFVLMVEGASIDKQSHLMDTDRWILEMLEFDRAVQKAKDFATANPDTIVIVTADHECSGAAIIGASTLSANALQTTNGSNSTVGVYEAAKFPKYTINADGYPASTDIDNKMLIGYGANADRYENWRSNAQPTQDSQQPFVGVAPLSGYPATPAARNTSSGFFIAGQVAGTQAVHTGTDIPLSAFGRGASLFTGVFDNTDVFFKLGQIAIGGAR